MLKNGFHENNTLTDFEQYLDELGLKVLHHEALHGSRKIRAYEHLRGGNWSSNNAEEYKPSDLYVLFDKSEDGVFVRASGCRYDPRNKKVALRKKFDSHGQSHIHMTDNTHQAMQYLKVMYPNYLEKYKAEIKAYDQNKHRNYKITHYRKIRYFWR